jgi:modulator of FtsH protease HflK
MLRKGQDKFKRFLPGGLSGGRGIGLILIGVFALWMLSGFYRVQPDEQGVVLRFGKWVATTPPGLNYHLPSPIESVITPSVTRVNKIEVGVRSIGRGGRSIPSRDVPEESLMLTGDENIVDVDFSVLWVVKDAGKFLFNIRDPQGTVKVAAESAMRAVVGQKPILSALTEGRDAIQQETQARAQRHLDEYGAGIEIREVQMQKIDPPQPVIDAFIDVQRAAADLERLRNEAEAYRNDILPRARGEAEVVIQAANAYKEQIVNKAQGEAQRYQAIYASYKAAKEVTKQRMYLETMEEVFARTNKVIIDPSAKSGGGVVPYLPLPEIQRRARQTPAQTPGAGQ